MSSLPASTRTEHEMDVPSLVSRYRRRIVVISFLCMATAFGLRLSFPIFFTNFLEEFHWQRAAMGGIFSVNLMIIGFSAPLIGYLVDRVGCHRVMTISAATLCVGLLASSAISTIWHLYLTVGVVLALGAGGIGMVAQSVTISNWFTRQRGTVLGLAASGTGVGILILGLATNHLIGVFGWRWTFRILALAPVALVLLIQLFHRNRPSDIVPPTVQPTEAEPSQAPEPGSEPDEEWTLRQAMRTFTFWLLAVGWVLFATGQMGVFGHLVLYLVDAGFTKGVAAATLGAIGVVSSGGRILFGNISDRIGRARTIVISLIFSAAGVLLLLAVSDPSRHWVLYVQVPCFGIAFGARGPITAVMMSEMYPGRALGAIYGAVTLGAGLGGLIGPWLVGYLFDQTGSYDLAFRIAASTILLPCLLFALGGWSWARRRKGAP